MLRAPALPSSSLRRLVPDARLSPARLAARSLLCGVVLAATAFAAAPVLAQEVPPDSTRRAAPDSVATDTVAADSIVAPTPPPAARTDTTRRLLPAALLPPGEAVGDTTPALHPALHAARLLAARAGSFVYDFAEAGWPSGWSPDGLPPADVALTLEGLPFDDLLTGGPRLDLLPLAWLTPLRTQPAHLGAPIGVRATLRPFVQAEPLTEIRMNRGGNDLETVQVVHTQRRRFDVRGRPGVFGILAGYGGYASDGAYEGSYFKGRHLLGRLRYDRPGLQLTLWLLHTRHRLGAHAGVVPPIADDPSSIYFPEVAGVTNSNSRRRTFRTDLALTARLGLGRSALAPLAVTGYRTQQRSRYRITPAAGDTVVAKAQRWGVLAVQHGRFGPHHWRLEAHAWLDRMVDAPAPEGNPDAVYWSAEARRTRGGLHLSLRDSTHLGPLRLAAAGGVRGSGAAFVPAATVQGELPLGPLRLRAEATTGGTPRAWIARYGLGPFAQSVALDDAARLHTGRLSATLTAGLIDVTLFGFAHRRADAVEPYVLTDGATATPDSIAFRSLPTTEHAGAGADIGWRRTARRGFYVAVQPTLYRFGDSARIPELAASLPDWFVRGRLGVRLWLFRGDLDLDVSARLRAWPDFAARTLHPATGLLVLPAPAQRRVEGAAVLDVVAEAKVRTATIFLAYENAYARTELLAGALLVPAYPLPARRFRLGVFWPILY